MILIGLGYLDFFDRPKAQENKRQTFDKVIRPILIFCPFSFSSFLVFVCIFYLIFKPASAHSRVPWPSSTPFFHHSTRDGHGQSFIQQQLHISSHLPFQNQNPSTVAKLKLFIIFLSHNLSRPTFNSLHRKIKNSEEGEEEKHNNSSIKGKQFSRCT